MLLPGSVHFQCLIRGDASSKRAQFPAVSLCHRSAGVVPSGSFHSALQPCEERTLLFQVLFALGFVSVAFREICLAILTLTLFITKLFLSSSLLLVIIYFSPPFQAAVKPLSPVEPLKLLNHLEPQMNSDTEKQNCSQRCDRPEETDPKGSCADKSRTEPLSEDPEVEGSEGSAAEEGVCVRAEEGMCSQHEGGEPTSSSLAGAEGSEPPSKDALHSRIKHRLAQLHTATDLNFTSGLAAQAAARSFTFTTMQEETFGDEEEECEDHVEDCQSEAGGSESDGQC